MPSGPTHIACTNPIGQVADISVHAFPGARNRGWTPVGETVDRSTDSGTNDNEPDEESGMTKESRNG